MLLRKEINSEIREELILLGLGLAKNMLPRLPRRRNSRSGAQTRDPSACMRIIRGEDHAFFCSHPKQKLLHPEISEIDNLREEDEFCVIEGMAEPTDAKSLMAFSYQDFLSPNRVITNTGMKIEELVDSVVNVLKAGDKHQITFLAREIYLLKSMKVPVGQGEVELHNLAMKKIKDAILHYIVYYVKESQ